MPNPTGKNQYSKGGGSKGAPKSASAIAAGQRSRSSGKVQLAPGTSSAAHAAFVASRMAAKRPKARSKSRRK